MESWKTQKISICWEQNTISYWNKKFHSLNIKGLLIIMDYLFLNVSRLVLAFVLSFDVGHSQKPPLWMKPWKFAKKKSYNNQIFLSNFWPTIRNGVKNYSCYIHKAILSRTTIIQYANSVIKFNKENGNILTRYQSMTQQKCTMTRLNFLQPIIQILNLPI